MPSLRLSAVAISCLAQAVLAQQWTNITVFHVNPSIYGPAPVNMDTADVFGDMYFDLRSVSLPMECAKPSAITKDCNNSEVVSDDLVITKLVLSVNPDFGPYGRCNICVNGTDHHGNNSCVDGVYDCICEDDRRHFVPCPLNVGYENVSHYHRACSDGDEAWECWRSKVAGKTGGAWYSTTADGYCGPDGSNPNCTWKVASVEKRVNKTCSDQSIFSAVEGNDPNECFETCSDSGTGADRNTSSACWITCFYDAVLGKNSSKPETPITGIDLGILAAAWDAPFRSTDPSRGGCPAI